MRPLGIIPPLLVTAALVAGCGSSGNPVTADRAVCHDAISNPDPSDAEIREGIALLAETTGIFTETAGGVSTAVLRKLAESGQIGPHERVVLVITGEGLKTLDAVRGMFETYAIAPTLEAFTATVPEPIAF